MIKYITLAIICIIAIVIFIITGKRIKQYKQQVQELSNQSEELSNLSNQKQLELEKIENKYTEYTKACEIELNRKERAQNDANLIEEYNKKMRSQAEESAQAYYTSTMATTQERLDKSLEQAAQSYRDAQAEYEQEYTQAMSDMAATAASYGKKTKQLLEAISDLENKQRAAIEANKRAAEEENKRDFYRIQISDSDLLEISKLREILPYLRDKDTVNKVIYKIYYENPVNDLIGRVVGKKTGGIYKITNINNGMCYVGQAVKIGR